MMKYFISAIIFIVLLNVNTIPAHSNSYFQANAGLGSFFITSVDLPTTLLLTPVHPNDHGDSQPADPDGFQYIPSLDMSLAVTPFPWKYFDLLRFGYTLKLPFYEPGYNEGIFDRKRYLNSSNDAYNYTKVDSFDTFAHELSIDYGWIFQNGSKLAVGCKYLIWGMEVAQGWDRYSTETAWRKTDGDITGIMPFISYELSGIQNSLVFDLNYANLDVDFGEFGNGKIRGFHANLRYIWRF